MTRIPVLFLAAFLLFSCNAASQDKGKKKKKLKKETTATAKSAAYDGFSVIARMPGGLKELSGIVRDGDYLWAISDHPKEHIYKLSLDGKVVQQLTLNNIAVSDVEDITADQEFLYIADIGDNDGSRDERQIIRIRKSSIGSGKRVDVDGERIVFSFPEQGKVKQKDNDYDCEALIHHNNALYLFTKRRSDSRMELFMLPKTPGKQKPRSIALFDSKGMITGAAVSPQGNEIALAGYQDGHRDPFIWLLSGFNGNNFFSGRQQQFSLRSGIKDWQVESIAYKDASTLFFGCEETKDEPASLYLIGKDSLAR